MARNSRADRLRREASWCRAHLGVNLAFAKHLRDLEEETFEGIAAFISRDANLASDGRTTRVANQRVTDNFFEVLGSRHFSAAPLSQERTNPGATTSRS